MVRMLEFVLYYLHWKKKTNPKKHGKKAIIERKAYADELEWL